VVLSSANTPDIAGTPISPTRRGPTRSTRMPIGMQKMPLVKAATEMPTDSCARDQPNSRASGSMNGPSE
jgi:hypothetical protein